VVPPKRFNTGKGKNKTRLVKEGGNAEEEESKNYRRKNFLLVDHYERSVLKGKRGPEGVREESKMGTTVRTPGVRKNSSADAPDSICGGGRGRKIERSHKQ